MNSIWVLFQIGLTASCIAPIRGKIKFAWHFLYLMTILNLFEIHSVVSFMKHSDRRTGTTFNRKHSFYALAHSMANLTLISPCIILSFILYLSLKYYGVFAQNKNCGGRETAVARQCPNATIEEVSRYVTRTAVARSSCVNTCAVTSRNNRRGVASGVLCGSAPRLYNEDLAQLELELREMTVEDDWGEITRKELGCAKKTSCVVQLQWDWYDYCIEIRCQDTTSEDWEF
jgi:hypothetical protein